MEDTEIIKLYFDRDQNAIEETRKKYGGYCLSLAERILGNIRIRYGGQETKIFCPIFDA